jgi:hypothetical protein
MATDVGVGRLTGTFDISYLGRSIGLKHAR